MNLNGVHSQRRGIKPLSVRTAVHEPEDIESVYKVMSWTTVVKGTCQPETQACRPRCLGVCLRLIFTEEATLVGRQAAPKRWSSPVAPGPVGGGGTTGHLVTMLGPQWTKKQICVYVPTKPMWCGRKLHPGAWSPGREGDVGRRETGGPTDTSFVIYSKWEGRKDSGPSLKWWESKEPSCRAHSGCLWPGALRPAGHRQNKHTSSLSYSEVPTFPQPLTFCARD